jgi:hypothetical protein
MTLCRGSRAYTSSGTRSGIGMRTVQTANISMNRAMTAASPGSGPAFTSPSGLTAASTLSLDWNVARAVTSRAEPSA